MEGLKVFCLVYLAFNRYVYGKMTYIERCGEMRKEKYFLSLGNLERYDFK